MFRKYSISEIHRQFEDGSLDPVAVAEACIARINRFNPEFHAWVCFDPDALIRGARSVRESLARKTSLRALEGIPVGVKDVFNTANFPTQMGSELWRGFTPGNDARVVYYLKNAGGLIVGKTVTAEFAVHALNETLNPHNVELTPGTSSSGSAVAVALGMVPVALGTQTGGSIIRPASFCGVYGFKPSFGLLPRTASLKTTDSLDTIGFFLSHPSDMRRVLDVLRVHGPNFPWSYRALKDHDRQNKPATRPWKVALVKTHTWSYAPEYARESLLNFAQTLGSQKEVDLVEVMLPASMEQTHEVHSTIYDKSLAYYFKEEYQSQDKMSLIMQEMIAHGEKISVENYHAALRTQNQLIAEMDDFLTGFDALICLSTAGAAPLRNVPEDPDPALMWTLMHLPAINAPVFTSTGGEPFGLQIVSRKYNDHLLTSFIDYLIMTNLLPKNPNPPKYF
ncbi:MAG: amidase [Magnetococcales bacterium]|nr:amidase [Magnetococcales bacterium]